MSGINTNLANLSAEKSMMETLEPLSPRHQPVENPNKKARTDEGRWWEHLLRFILNFSEGSTSN